MSKASPIIPLVTNILSFGIPAIAGAVERGKARKAEKNALEVQRAGQAASAQAASSIGTVMAGAGVVVGSVDQIGLGAELMQAATQVPIEVLPAHAPEWVQWSYLVVTVLGVVVRLLAAKFPKPQPTI